MNLFQVLVLAIVQGLAELLPVSSSAHVIMTEKLMGLDPTSPVMTLLLVMLHTGTMFAVIMYYWSHWKQTYFSSWQAFKSHAGLLVFATMMTGIVGLTLQYIIKHVFMHNDPNFEIENLFGNSKLIAAALFATALIIIASSFIKEGRKSQVNLRTAGIIGMVQGLCLPFRGFSRSGATISTGMLVGINRRVAESFSFALAVVLTPVVLAKELYRVVHPHAAQQLTNATHAATQTATALPIDWTQTILYSLVGMVLSFGVGLLALRWLSSWLETGRWYLFSIYCMCMAGFILWLG